MATPQESLQYNRASIYPLAGINVLYSKVVNLLSTGATLLSSDYLTEFNTSDGAITVYLPEAPYTGEMHQFSDTVGQCATFNATIQGNGKLINGAASALIATNFGGFTIRYNGTQWVILK